MDINHVSRHLFMLAPLVLQHPALLTPADKEKLIDQFDNKEFPNSP